MRPGVIHAWFDTALGLVELLLVMVLGANRWLLRLCERWCSRWKARVPPTSWMARVDGVMQKLWSGSGWGVALLFTLLFGVANNILAFPEDFYFSFIRERAYGLSNYTLAGFLWDDLKGALVGVGSVTVLCFGLYGLMRRTRWWWLLLGVGSAALLTVSGLIDPYRANLYYDHHSLEPGPIRDAVSSVLAKAQVPFQDVVVLEVQRATTRADAYIAGQGPTRTVVIFDTMLMAYTPQEIATAVAHEMGHLHESIIGRKVVSALLMIPLLGLFNGILAWARTRRLGFDHPTDVSGLPLTFLAFMVLTLLAGPVSGAFQRAREAAADQYALRLTGETAPFISLLTKLTLQAKADPIPPLLQEVWMMDHPSVSRRIAMALRFDQGKP